MTGSIVVEQHPFTTKPRSRDCLKNSQYNNLQPPTSILYLKMSNRDSLWDTLYIRSTGHLGEPLSQGPITTEREEFAQKTKRHSLGRFGQHFESPASFLAFSFYLSPDGSINSRARKRETIHQRGYRLQGNVIKSDVKHDIKHVLSAEMRNDISCVNVGLAVIWHALSLLLVLLSFFFLICCCRFSRYV